jgi:hypothetical protein
MCLKTRHAQNRENSLNLIANYYKRTFPNGFYTVQISGTAPGETVVDEFEAKEKAIHCFQQIWKRIESGGFEVRDQTALCLSFDPGQPQEIMKIDVWKEIYLHTIRLLHYSPEIDKEHILRLQCLKGKLVGSQLNLPQEPKWWEKE